MYKLPLGLCPGVLGQYVTYFWVPARFVEPRTYERVHVPVDELPCILRIPGHVKDGHEVPNADHILVPSKALYRISVFLSCQKY